MHTGIYIVRYFSPFVVVVSSTLAFAVTIGAETFPLLLLFSNFVVSARLQCDCLLLYCYCTHTWPYQLLWLLLLLLYGYTRRTCGKRAGAPLSCCPLTLYQRTSRELGKRLLRWPKVEYKRLAELRALKKVHLAAIVGVLTGHCEIGNHAMRLGMLPGTNCCLEEGEVKTPSHFHCCGIHRDTCCESTSFNQT